MKEARYEEKSSRPRSPARQASSEGEALSDVRLALFGDFFRFSHNLFRFFGPLAFEAPVSSTANFLWCFL
jgi:hypothetical protein